MEFQYMVYGKWNGKNEIPNRRYEFFEKKHLRFHPEILPSRIIQ